MTIISVAIDPLVLTLSSALLTINLDRLNPSLLLGQKFPSVPRIQPLSKVVEFFFFFVAF